MVIGFHKSTEPFEFDDRNWFGYEKPSVLEAFRVLAKEGYYVTISGHDYDMRKKRLKEEYEKNTKAPGPGEEQPKESNPALKEAASQFNDALLDEQAKKIKRLGKEIARLNGIIHDKNAVLSDVAEELRLSKIREKNLTELCQKYIKANEELKKELADKVVGKIDAQALKSAESALAYKEKVIADLGKELSESKKRVEWVRNASKEYCDYGVAANEFIKELAGLYVLANNTRIINDEMLERCKNYQTYGFPANCDRETKKEINDIASGKTKAVGVDIAEEGGDHSAIIVQCYKDITTISKDEAEIIERCTKNGTELHYSEKDGFTYTNMYGEEMPIRCLRGMFHVFTDEEIKNTKK